MKEVSRAGIVARAREVVRHEAEAVGALAGQFDECLADIVSLLFDCRGHVLVTGAGTSRAIAHPAVARPRCSSVPPMACMVVRGL